jgi:TRAP-type C4-dicarboxylate transport system substrate-binding protein
MQTFRHPVVAAALSLAPLTVAAVGCGHEATIRDTVLRVAGTDVVGPQNNNGLARFAARVEQLSHGSVRVRLEVVRSTDDPDKTGLHEPVDDRAVIRRTASGRFDLAWVKTQAFDGVGVHAFDALDAPLLIDSYRTQAAVLRSDVPGRMLQATARAGVTGLGLLAGRISRRANADHPLVTAGDFEHRTWRAVASTGRGAAVHALGGQLDHVLYPWFMLPIRLKSGDIQVLDSDLNRLFFELVPQTPTVYVTENVRLWPDMTVLIANPRRMERLTSKQREWVEQAARDAQAYSASHANDDVMAARDLCATGVRFAEAPHATVAGLRQALAPAYTQLARDVATGAYVRRMQQLRRDAGSDPPLSVPPGCRASHPAPAGGGPRVQSPLPDGVYRVRLTQRDLRAAHVTGLDVRRFAGTQTLTLDHGKWTLEWQGRFGRSTASGSYAGSPARTAWRTLLQDGKRVKPFSVRRFSFSRDGGMLHIVPGVGSSDLENAWYGARPWRRIE